MDDQSILKLIAIKNRLHKKHVAQKTYFFTKENLKLK